MHTTLDGVADAPSLHTVCSTPSRLCWCSCSHTQRAQTERRVVQRVCASSQDKPAHDCVASWSERKAALSRRSSQPCRQTKLRLEASLGHGGQGAWPHPRPRQGSSCSFHGSNNCASLLQACSTQHLSLLSFLTIGIAAGADELLVSGSKVPRQVGQGRRLGRLKILRRLGTLRR